MCRASVGGSHRLRRTRGGPIRTTGRARRGTLWGMPGVRITRGSDFQIPSFTIEIADDGTLTSPPIVPRLRTDTWSFWLEDAVEAAVEASRLESELPTVRAGGDEEDLTRAMVRELRSTMRAITAAAFATDAFYASVKARSPAHPHEHVWRAKGRTQRYVQVYETLRYHLKLRRPGDAEIRNRIRELFRFRDWAVHPGSKYREPVYREDLDSGVDWHFAVFRAENAVNATSMTVQMLDALVECLHRGSPDLRAHRKAARIAMDDVLTVYAGTSLPAMRKFSDAPNDKRAL
jgi:hypothetical protein